MGRSPPTDFTEADTDKAASYAQTVEVLIWTPGLTSGRPLTLSGLPDFTALGDDPDERAKAVEMAKATLLPFIGPDKLKAGVLADTLRNFADMGGGSLDDLIALLADLPEGVSKIGKATKLAADMADQLLAAIATNPLLTTRGTPLDPQVLFGDDTQGKDPYFRHQFLRPQLGREPPVTWIKKHPSTTGRLYAIDEAQNFAPSQKMIPCREHSRACHSGAQIRARHDLRHPNTKSHRQ
jgi:hypothetical protein